MIKDEFLKNISKEDIDLERIEIFYPLFDIKGYPNRGYSEIRKGIVFPSDQVWHVEVAPKATSRKVAGAARYDKSDEFWSDCWVDEYKTSTVKIKKVDIEGTLIENIEFDIEGCFSDVYPKSFIIAERGDKTQIVGTGKYLFLDRGIYFWSIDSEINQFSEDSFFLAELCEMEMEDKFTNFESIF